MVVGDQKKHVSIKSFEELDCWKACRQLRLFVVQEVIPVLPLEEKYRLADQLIRAARSTTANVALRPVG